MTDNQINALLDRLVGFEPTSLPVISVYLNAQPNNRGRDQYEPFVRKELSMRAKTYAEHSPERESFDRDAERIMAYLGQIDPSANGVAIFACAGENDFWEALQLDAPIERNQLFVYNQPHLYPLARVYDQYPRYAALLIDTHSARLFVFGGNALQTSEDIENIKTSRSDAGGWSQARYQRHNENFHLQHAKEVIDKLDQVVRAEGIEHVIISGDEVIVPVLREHMSQFLLDKLVDVVPMDMTTPEHEVLQKTLESLKQHDRETDSEQVEQLFEHYRAGGGGLAVVGAADTLAALNNGQVDRLLITASAREIDADNQELARTVAAYKPGENTAPGTEDGSLEIADELITKARQTAAAITFIEDRELLKDVEGVGALLRWRTQA